MTSVIGLIAFFGALIASIDPPHAGLVKGNINSGDYPAAMATELDIEIQPNSRYILNMAT